MHPNLFVISVIPLKRFVFIIIEYNTLSSNFNQFETIAAKIKNNCLTKFWKLIMNTSILIPQPKHSDDNPVGNFASLFETLTKAFENFIGTFHFAFFQKATFELLYSRSKSAIYVLPCILKQRSEKTRPYLQWQTA